MKPGFFKNEELAECGMTARVLFAGLWCFADREGRLEDRPKRIKAEIFPYDEVLVEPVIDCLVEKGFLFRYQSAGRDYLQIVSFVKHQKPHPKEQASTIPAPDDLPCNYTAMPCKEQYKPGLSLSLLPSTTLSGKPDVATLPEDKKTGLQHQAREILQFLNNKTGKRYQPVRVNLDMIQSRLKEGATVMQCRQIIARKTRDWQTDEKMAQYLRPATLFNRTKFWQYMGELVPENADEPVVP